MTDKVLYMPAPDDKREQLVWREVFRGDAETAMALEVLVNDESHVPTRLVPEAQNIEGQPCMWMPLFGLGVARA